MIVCRTLGPVQAILQDGSAPADLQWAKNLALLVYLARSPEGTRTREHLIGLLWGDKPESKARQSLNTALSLLRGHAGDEAVVSDSTRAALRPHMRDVGRAGDRAGAWKQLDAFAARLARELGTEAAPDTRALAPRVRLARTWRIPKGGGGGGAARAEGEPRRSPLVGRAR